MAACYRHPKYSTYIRTIQKIQQLCTGTTETTKISSTTEFNKTSKTNDYKVPEYYKHDKWTFLDLMIDMEKYRLPQPSAKKL